MNSCILFIKRNSTLNLGKAAATNNDDVADDDSGDEEDAGDDKKKKAKGGVKKDVQMDEYKLAQYSQYFKVR